MSTIKLKPSEVIFKEDIYPRFEVKQGHWTWVDPMLEFYKLINRYYKVESRYVIPYSTQQYSGLWVDRAKENRRCFILNRELTVFSRELFSGMSGKLVQNG